MKQWLVTLLLLACCQSISAAELFGTVDALNGNASASEAGGTANPLEIGSKIYEGQTLVTSQNSELHIVTEDGAFIALRPDTTFRIDEYQAAGDAATDKVFMSLLKGSMRSITGWIGKYSPPSYRLTTPSATIGIRGTDHETTVIVQSDADEAGTYDTVNEGETVLSNAQGATEVTPGRHAFASWHKTIAPLFLSHRPYFWTHRRLRIEQRIVGRKAYLWQRMEQLRNARRQARQAAKTDSRAEKRDLHREQMQQRREERHQQRKTRKDEDS